MKLEAAFSPLVLKAWEDALKEAAPGIEWNPQIMVRHDPDEVEFRALDPLSSTSHHIRMTNHLLFDLLSKKMYSALPDAQCDPLYECLLAKLKGA